MKFVTTLLFFLSLVVVSCKKKTKDINPADTYGEKIVGTWNRDSVLRFNSDSTFIEKITDPYTYTFIKGTEGPDQYVWIHNTNTSGITVQMLENEGEMYQLTLGESTWRWEIRYIDTHNCYLYRPPGSMVPFIEKIYLSR